MDSLDSVINIGIPYCYTGHILKIICGKQEDIGFTRGVVECSTPGELKCTTESLFVFHSKDSIFGDVFLYFTDVLTFFPLLLLNIPPDYTGAYR